MANNELITHGNEVRKKILTAIVEYISNHGYPPTVREIGRLTNIKSTATVHWHLKKMREKGLIETDEKGVANRAIRVPGYKFVRC